MMQVYTIETPSGRKIKIEAPDQETAIRGAQEWEASQGQPQKREPHANVPEYDPGIPGYNPETGMVERQFGMTDSAMLGAADTTTFGFGDEVMSYPLSWMTGDPREKVLSDLRTMQGQAQEQNPGSYLAGQVAGGVAQGVAAAPVSLTAQTTRATPLMGRVAAGMGDGAIFGGIYGAGSGTDAQSRMTEAAMSGALGAAAGGVLPVVAAGASRAFEAGRNAMGANRIARQAGASPEALRTLGGVMEADGSLTSRGALNMSRAGRDAMLADAGPNARAVLDTAIQRGGPGSVAAREAIGKRVQGASRSLRMTLDATLGTPQGVNAAQNNIRNATRGIVNKTYERAYAQPINYSAPAGRKVEDIINRIPGRIAQRAINSASEQMAYDGLPRMQGLISIADDGSVTFKQLPNVMQADYIKRALNAIVDDGTDPMTGKLSSDAAFAARMARDLRDALSEAVPAYKLALQTAADPLSQQSAIRLGARILSPGMTRDQVAEAVKGMTKPERAALAQGIRSQIDDAMANVARTVQDGDTPAREAVKALRDLSSRANREKLAMAIGKEKADALFRELDRVATSFDLRASVTDNSKTFARQATNEGIRERSSAGPVRTAARGEAVNATKRVVQQMTGETPERIRGREDAVYNELARLLTRPGGAGQDVYDAIQKIGQTDASTALMADRINRALAGPHLAYPLATQQEGMLRR